MIKVSIIVPIYNAGFRLHECLDTLINQTLHEIEIICVLDCPIDGSDKVVEEYATRDKRIKLVYNEKKLHVAESRNKGIAIAQGEYIGFSDHDDIRDLKMYEKLYQIAKLEDYDIVFSNSIYRYENGDRVHRYLKATKQDIISSLVIGDNYRNKNFSSSAVWASIYKNTFIKCHEIEFPDRRVYLEEDSLFNLQAFLLTDKLKYIDETFYVWNKYEDSLSNEWGTNEGVTRLNFFIKKFELLEDSNMFFQFRKEWIVAFQNTLHRYFSFFKKLDKINMQRLIELIKKTKYPIIGKYENLKLLSRKRIQLYWFVYTIKNLNRYGRNA